MGAWGYGPFDNDTAGEFVYLSVRSATRMTPLDVVHVGLMKPVKRAVDTISDVSARYRYEEARAAAFILTVVHGAICLPSMHTVLRALVRARRDMSWLADFNSPRKIADALDRELLHTMSSISACRGCRRVHDEMEMDSLRRLMQDARESPIPHAYARPNRRKLGR